MMERAMAALLSKRGCRRLFYLLMGLFVLNFMVQWSWSSSTPPAPSRPVEDVAATAKKTVVLSKHPRWIVITTIQAPTPQVERLCRIPGWKTVVVGDVSTPETAWEGHSHCLFLGMKEQAALGYSIIKRLPTRNYGRKNIGYLYAYQHGANEVIYETDDDNEPAAKGLWFITTETKTEVAYLSADGPPHVQNPLSHFGRPDLWPRGYPLKEINASRQCSYVECDSSRSNFPIQQGIVNLDHDADAVFRMTQPLSVGHVHFDDYAPPVALVPGTYSPFNSQNTFWRASAFWGLIIPVTTTMRVCDIWRSFWVQRILWEVGEELLFLPATAEQVRNPHDFHKDYLEERDLYEKSQLLINFLEDWTCAASLSLFDCIRQLTHRMAEEGYWGELDAELTSLWLDDLLALGYQPPARKTRIETKCILIPPCMPIPVSRRWIHISVAVTSRNLKKPAKRFVELPLFKYLLPSLIESLEPTRYRYDISLGADRGDAWYDNRTRQAEMQRWWAKEWAAEHPRICAPNLTFAVYDNTVSKPNWASDYMDIAAYHAGADCFYLLNDDTITFANNWSSVFLAEMDNFRPIPRLGVTGPRDDFQKGKVLTHPFVCRPHFDVFGGLFPWFFWNWFSDNWIQAVYSPPYEPTKVFGPNASMMSIPQHVPVKHIVLRARYNVTGTTERYKRQLAIDREILVDYVAKKL